MTDQYHRLKILIRTYHSLWQWFRYIQTQSCEDHTNTLHNHRHTLQSRDEHLTKLLTIGIILAAEHTFDGLTLSSREIEVALVLCYTHPQITLTQLARQTIIKHSLMRYTFINIRVPNIVIKVLGRIDHITSETGHKTILAAVQEGFKLVRCSWEKHWDMRVTHLNELVIFTAELANGFVFKDTTDDVGYLTKSRAKHLGQGIHLCCHNDTTTFEYLHHFHKGRRGGISWDIHLFTCLTFNGLQQRATVVHDSFAWSRRCNNHGQEVCAVGVMRLTMQHTHSGQGVGAIG